MTNFEIYKEDLLKIKGQFAVDKARRRVVGCSADGLEGCIDCKDCLFNDTPFCCENDKIKWLYEEYEPPVLSDDELELIKAIGKISGKEYKYVARDARDVIKLFEIKPSISKSGNCYGESTHVDINVRPEGKIFFTNITHEDGLYDIKNKCFIKEEGDD